MLQKCKECILFCFVFPTGPLFCTHCTTEKSKEQEERPNIQKRIKEYIRNGKINKAYNRSQNDKGKGEPETKEKRENKGEIGLQKHLKKYKRYFILN